jgi:predicted nucleic acid-binding protein
VKFLVDANVLSEPTRSVPDPAVTAWLRDHESELVIDPVILGEIRYGILLLPKGRKRKLLEAWFESGIHRLRCLEWTGECALVWAELLATLRRKDRRMPVKDSLIAATALRHSLTVATRNVADFKSAGVPVINPFSNLPS